MIGESEVDSLPLEFINLPETLMPPFGGIARHFEGAFNSFFEFCTGPFQVVLLSWEDFWGNLD